MSENEVSRAGTTILKEFSLFNQAVVFYEEHVSPVISAAIGKHVTEWLEKHWWKGEADVSDTLDDLWACPASWIESEEKPFARFHLQAREANATSSYEIADLFSVGQTDFGFRFIPEYSWFGGKSAWNSKVKTLGPQIEAIARTGWINEGKGVLFRPVNLSSASLVGAWENDDWSEALAPLTNELSAVETNKKLFDNLLYRARPKVG